MTIATLPRQSLNLAGLLNSLTRPVRVLALQLRRNRAQQRCHRRGFGNQLDSLSDRLRQDIGLSDSSPSPKELRKRFHQMHAPYPREHEIRLRFWIR